MKSRPNHPWSFGIGFTLAGIGTGALIDKIWLGMLVVGGLIMILAWFALPEAECKARVNRIRPELALFCATLERLFGAGNRSLEGVAKSAEWPPEVSAFRQMLSQWKDTYYAGLGRDERTLYELAEKVYPRDKPTEYADFDRARRIIKDELDWFGDNRDMVGLVGFWKQHLDKYWPWIRILAYLEIALAVRARPKPGPLTGGLWELPDLHARVARRIMS